MAISGSSFLVAHIQCQENAVEIGHINYNIIYITLCSVVLTNNKWTITFLPFYGCNHLTLTFNNRFAKITELLSRMMAEPAQHQKLSQQFNCTYKTALKGITLCTSITTVTIINNAFFWWKIILTSHHRWHPHGLGGKGFIMGTGYLKLECGPMPKVMVALSNIGGAFCSTPQSLADAHYWSTVQ